MRQTEKETCARTQRERDIHVAISQATPVPAPQGVFVLAEGTVLQPRAEAAPQVVALQQKGAVHAGRSGPLCRGKQSGFVWVCGGVSVCAWVRFRAAGGGLAAEGGRARREIRAAVCVCVCVWDSV